jgi:hypothetical protein
MDSYAYEYIYYCYGLNHMPKSLTKTYNTKLQMEKYNVSFFVSGLHNNLFIYVHMFLL